MIAEIIDYDWRDSYLDRNVKYLRLKINVEGNIEYIYFQPNGTVHSNMFLKMCAAPPINSPHDEFNPKDLLHKIISVRYELVTFGRKKEWRCYVDLSSQNNINGQKDK